MNVKFWTILASQKIAVFQARNPHSLGYDHQWYLDPGLTARVPRLFACNMIDLRVQADETPMALTL